MSNSTHKLTVGYLRKSLQDKSGKYIGLMEAFRMHIGNVSRQAGISLPDSNEITKGHVRTISIGQLKIYETTAAHVTEYLGRKKDIDFEDIDRQWMEGFRHFLLEKKHDNNTAAKYIKALKAVINWASQEGFHSNEKFKLVH